MKSRTHVAFLLLVVFAISLINVNIIQAVQNYDDEVKIIKVYYSTHNSYAIDESGRLWGWGYNEQIGVLNEDNHNKLLPVVIMDGVKDVAAGISNCYVIKNDGTLWAWGWNKDGQLGDGTTIDKKAPVKIMDDIKKIFVSYNQVAAIKTDDSLWMWGENSSDYAILGDGSYITKTSPTKIMDNVKEVSFAISNLILQNDGKLWMVDTKTRKPKLVEEFSNVKDIAKGYYVLDNNSTLYYFNNYLGRKTPVVEEVEKVFKGSSYNIYYLTKGGSLWGIGADFLGDGTGVSDNPLSQGVRQSPISMLKGVVDVSSDEDNCIALLDDGSVWTWGRNQYGQIGDGSCSQKLIPTKISFSQKFASMMNAFSGINYTPKNYIRVFYDGSEISFDVKPQIVSGCTLVPMRGIFEKFGLTVSWDNSTKVAEGTSNGSKISFKIGSKVATVNGVTKSLDVPAQEIGGKTMIPLRFLSESMGYNVVWVNNSKLILLSKNDIIEWRYGGYEKAEPHKEYEYKYVNGVKTSDFRYTGTFSHSVASATPTPNGNSGSSETNSLPAQSKEKKSVLSAEDIYTLCAPSVFRIETYDKDAQPIALGSGFFITSDGMAVTNYHVIEGATFIRLTLTDGSYYWVDEVLASSKEKDIAILKIKASDVKPLSIGDSANIKGGQTIYTIGNPEGLSNTISDGIISNPKREVDKATYIQISAPISHGSSGGALINKYGQVIGITSAYIDGGQNLNLAIPINQIYTLKLQ